MKILGLDTSTKNLSLALFNNEELISYRNAMVGRSMAASILPKIKQFLSNNDLDINKIDGYLVGLGPGSFTGLRIGAATVKGLAFSKGHPIGGQSSLDAIAYSVNNTNSNICVISDAKRSMVYSCTYKRTKSGLKRLTPYTLSEIGNVLSKIDSPSVVVGDGVDVYMAEIKKSKMIDKVFTEKKYIFPQARYFIHAGFRQLKAIQQGKKMTVEPMYLYKEDCQVRK